MSARARMQAVVDAFDESLNGVDVDPSPDGDPEEDWDDTHAACVLEIVEPDDRSYFNHDDFVTDLIEHARKAFDKIGRPCLPRVGDRAPKKAPRLGVQVLHFRVHSWRVSVETYPWRKTDAERLEKEASKAVARKPSDGERLDWLDYADGTDRLDYVASLRGLGFSLRKAIDALMADQRCGKGHWAKKSTKKSVKKVVKKAKKSGRPA